MLVMAVHQVPSLTQERYEEVVLRLTGKSCLESPSDLPFEDLLFHAAGEGKNGFCIVDVFESEEAVQRFNEAMGSLPREVGIEEPPDFFPARERFSEAQAAAGVEGKIRAFHDMRHTALTNLAATGASPIAVMATAGHRSMQTTKGYLHLAGVVFRNDSNNLEARLLGVQETGTNEPETALVSQER